VISDLATTNPAAIGNLNVFGGGELELGGANTYTGTTTISGASSILKLVNALALQNSTLNYNNQGGTLDFGALTAATFGGLSGSEDLALVNDSPAAVNLTIGNNNVTSTYTGNLSGAGTLTKTGTGSFTLGSGSTGGGSITGNVYASQGTLIIGGTSYLTGSVGSAGISGGTNQLTVTDNAVINSTGSFVADGYGALAYSAPVLITVSGNANVTVGTAGFGNGANREGANVFTIS
jgi:hypothetical protein